MGYQIELHIVVSRVYLTSIIPSPVVSYKIALKHWDSVSSGGRMCDRVTDKVTTTSLASKDFLIGNVGSVLCFNTQVRSQLMPYHLIT